MTQDEIIEMARQAGLPETIIEMTPIAFERFAKLVAEREREACAKVCDDHWEKDGAAYYCALTIRYRGQA
jgi:hypothetical protein